MTRKTVGYVRLVWTCPRCGTRNPGPNGFCNGCGAPQPEDVKFEQPAEAELLKDAAEIARAKATPDRHCPYCGTRNPGAARFCGACGGDLAGAKGRAKGEVVGAYRAPSGATRSCPACGTPNPLTAVKCSQCGSALPAETAPAAPSAPVARRSTTGVVVGGVLGVLCVAGVAAVLLLSARHSEVVATVDSVSWERAVDIERFGPVEHEDWEDRLPAEARLLSCQLAYRETSDAPAPVATEVCGTPYTVDQGSGYGEVVQDCAYRVYQPLCRYTVDEWTVVETVRASGNDLSPAWPNVQLDPPDERRGPQRERYQVTFVAGGKTLAYAPATAGEFAAFAIGSRWTIVVNGLGAILSVEPAP